MKHTAITDDLYDYLVAHGSNADPLLAELARVTTEKVKDLWIMQIAPEQGTLMEILVRVSGARSAIENRDVHGIQRHLHRPRFTGRRLASLLRYQRRVDVDRSRILGQGPASLPRSLSSSGLLSTH